MIEQLSYGYELDEQKAKQLRNIQHHNTLIIRKIQGQNTPNRQIVNPLYCLSPYQRRTNAVLTPTLLDHPLERG